jgi:hypothetical protein
LRKAPSRAAPLLPSDDEVKDWNCASYIGMILGCAHDHA